MKKECLELAQDNVTSNHYGQIGTYNRLVCFVYWKGMRQDAVGYVQSCAECNVSKKANRKPKSALQTYHAGYRMERVHLDIHGPLEVTQLGNSYILVMVDQFTKWVELEPLPEQTAVLTAKAAVGRFFSNLGYPRHIYTDQGRNFVSELFNYVTFSK